VILIAVNDSALQYHSMEAHMGRGCESSLIDERRQPLLFFSNFTSVEKGSLLDRIPSGLENSYGQDGAESNSAPARNQTLPTCT